MNLWHASHVIDVRCNIYEVNCSLDAYIQTKMKKLLKAIRESQNIIFKGGKKHLPR